MNKEEVSEFFGCLGEIWRDVTALEFLMRAAIARSDGEIDKFPTPPYTKQRIYTDYPDSFSHYSFEMVVSKFNKRFPDVAIPNEVVLFRNAMAHGTIAEIQNSGVPELVKFIEDKEKKPLKIEFSMKLERQTLLQLRQSLKELRRYVAIKVADQKV